MAGEIIDLNLADAATRGYVARPETASGPGLLLVGDSLALERHVTDTADLYAEEG